MSHELTQITPFFSLYSLLVFAACVKNLETFCLKLIQGSHSMVALVDDFLQAIVASRDVNYVVGIDCAKLCLRALSSSIILPPQERHLLHVCLYILKIQASANGSSNN